MMCSKSHRTPVQNWRPHSEPQGQTVSQRHGGRSWKYEKENEILTIHSMNAATLALLHWIQDALWSLNPLHPSTPPRQHGAPGLHPTRTVCFTPELISAFTAFTARARSSTCRVVWTPPRFWFLCHGSRRASLLRHSFTHSPHSCRRLAICGSLLADTECKGSCV